MEPALTTKNISICLEQTPRAVLARANKEQWPSEIVRGRGGKKHTYNFATLPDDVKVTIIAKYPNLKSKQALVQASSDLPIKYTKDQIKIHCAKIDILRFYNSHVKKAPTGKKNAYRNEFVNQYNNGKAYPQLFKIVNKIGSWRTVQGWQKQLLKSKTPYPLADTRGFHRKDKSRLTEEQKEILVKHALHPNQPLISEVIRIAKSTIAARGIPIKASDRTCRRWLQKYMEKNYPSWVFSREGSKALNDKCLPYIERDYSKINVGDVLIADGHTLNFEVLNPYTGKPGRPTLILWYDMKSNFPLGWEIMPTENTQAISSALRRAIIRLGKYPKVVYLDNGKAFRARFFEGHNFEEDGFSGLYDRLDIKTIFAWPYHGQSKTVERFFKDLAELERLIPTCVGNSIANKPPRLNRGEKIHRKVYSKAFPAQFITLEQANIAIASWFDLYVTRNQLGHLEGQNPLELYIEGRGPGVDLIELRHLMMNIEIKTINRNGIRFRKKNYYHPKLFNRNHPVTIKYDLQDDSKIYVFDQDETFICEASPVGKVHPAATHLGTDDDRKILKESIEFKKRLEKDATASARAFLLSDVLPEQQRRLKRLGIDQLGMPLDASRKKPIEPDILTPAKEKKIRVEIELQRKLQQEGKTAISQEPEYIPEIINEATDIRDQLREMDEMERYEKITELEVRGLMIPKEYQAFTTYFELTPEYKKYKDYFEEYRAKMALMYQVDIENNNPKNRADAGTPTPTPTRI